MRVRVCVGWEYNKERGMLRFCTVVFGVKEGRRVVGEERRQAPKRTKGGVIN